MPKRLIDELVRRRALAESSVAALEEHHAKRGGAIDTAILELNLVPEMEVATALASSYGVEGARPTDATARVDELAVRSFPQQWALKHRLAPLSIDPKLGTLTLLSTAPIDLARLRELGELLELKLRARVATEIRVFQRLALLYGETPPPHILELLNLAGGLGDHAIRKPTAPSDAPPALLTTQPRTFGEAVERLRDSRDRDEIVQLTLSFARKDFSFAAWFAVRERGIKGWNAIGLGSAEIATIEIGPDAPSALWTAARTGAHFLGPLSASDRACFAPLGRQPPRAALIVPLRLRGKTFALIYVENGARAISPRDAADLMVYSTHVHQATEALLLARKADTADPVEEDLATPELASEPPDAVEAPTDTPDRGATAQADEAGAGDAVLHAATIESADDLARESASKTIGESGASDPQTAGDSAGSRPETAGVSAGGSDPALDSEATSESAVSAPATGESGAPSDPETAAESGDSETTGELCTPGDLETAAESGDSETTGELRTPGDLETAAESGDSETTGDLAAPSGPETAAESGDAETTGDLAAPSGPETAAESGDAETTGDLAAPSGPASAGDSETTGESDAPSDPETTGEFAARPDRGAADDARERGAPVDSGDGRERDVADESHAGGEQTTADADEARDQRPTLEYSAARGVTDRGALVESVEHLDTGRTVELASAPASVATVGSGQARDPDDAPAPITDEIPELDLQDDLRDTGDIEAPMVSADDVITPAAMPVVSPSGLPPFGADGPAVLIDGPAAWRTGRTPSAIPAPIDNPPADDWVPRQTKRMRPERDSSWDEPSTANEGAPPRLISGLDTPTRDMPMVAEDADGGSLRSQLERAVAGTQPPLHDPSPMELQVTDNTGFAEAGGDGDTAAWSLVASDTWDAWAQEATRSEAFATVKPPPGAESLLRTETIEAPSKSMLPIVEDDTPDTSTAQMFEAPSNAMAQQAEDERPAVARAHVWDAPSNAMVQQAEDESPGVSSARIFDAPSYAPRPGAQDEDRFAPRKPATKIRPSSAFPPYAGDNNPDVSTGEMFGTSTPSSSQLDLQAAQWADDGEKTRFDDEDAIDEDAIDEITHDGDERPQRSIPPPASTTVDARSPFAAAESEQTDRQAASEFAGEPATVSPADISVDPRARPAVSRIQVAPSALAEPLDAAQLVLQLESDDEADRAAASVQLRALGSAALPAFVGHFPGPLTADPFAPRGVLPPFADCGPVLSLVAACGDAAHPMVMRALDSRLPLERFFATYFYTDVHVPEAVPRLTRRLHDEEPRISRLAVRTLKTYDQDPEFSGVIEHLHARLISPSLSARKHAASFLGQFRDETAVPELIAVLERKEKGLTDVAQRALVEITKQSFAMSARKWNTWWDNNKGSPRIEWLIAGLESKDRAIRSSSGKELLALTGMSLGYNPDGSKREREEARRRWVNWWRRQGGALPQRPA